MMLTGQTGVVTKNPGWYGRIVQWFTGSPAYHCVYAVSETMCVSAETPVVRYRPISWFADVQWTTETMDPILVGDAVRWAAHQVGKPYAWYDIILLVWASIRKRKTADPIKDHVESERQWFCSELCDAAMMIAGVSLFPGRPPCAVTPKDFLDAIRERTQAR